MRVQMLVKQDLDTRGRPIFISHRVLTGQCSDRGDCATSLTGSFRDEATGPVEDSPGGVLAEGRWGLSSERDASRRQIHLFLHHNDFQEQSDYAHQMLRGNHESGQIMMYRH